MIAVFRARFVGPIVCILLVACSTPPEAPLDDQALTLAATTRAARPSDLALALQLADVAPLAIPRPAEPVATDRDDPAFWDACAFAWDPTVRQARRRFLAAQAAIDSAGQPAPFDGSAEHVQNGRDRETDLMLTFDLLGIFGVGRSAADRALAEEEARAALGALEDAVWKARFAVARARLRVAASHARSDAYDALAHEAAGERPRIEILARNGRLAPADVQWAWSMVHHAEGLGFQVRGEEASAIADLVKATGLRSDHPAIAAITGEGLPKFFAPDDPPPPVVTPARLLAAHPRLRARRLEYAVAEARLRREAAEQWPEIMVGPKAMILPDMALPGGAIGLKVPWPGAADGRIAAAVEQRHAAREALEDELVAVQADFTAARDRYVAAALEWQHHAALDAATRAYWTASRARFHSDPAMLEAWAMGIERQIDSQMLLLEAREKAALAAIDLLEAAGPDPAAASREASNPAPETRP